MHDAQSSDPIKMGWMLGFPPAESQRIMVRDASAYRFPQIRWSFSHYQELYPTRPIDRGSSPTQQLSLKLRDDLDAICFKPIGDNEPMRWDQSLENNFTDGIVVLHRWGNLLFESSDLKKGWDGTYRGQQQPPETYMWVVEGLDTNGKSIKKTGMLTLIR